MKRLLISISLSVVALCANSQNIQLHYDFGSAMYDELAERPRLTSTVEMFRADSWGSTYFFVDMDYTRKGVASGYWEISRELRFWQPPVSVHLEYDGGLSNQYSYNNAYLFGGTYTWNNAAFTRGFALTAMYKYIQGHSNPNNFQLTGTWYLHFAENGLCTFTGFIDWWREKCSYADGSSTDFILTAEPQFWVNLGKLKGVNDKFRLSIGTEVEIGHNFSGRKGWYAIPTFAIKWTFD